MRSPATKSVLKGRWYFVVTVCSFGLLAWVPFVHARTYLRRRSVTVKAWCYAGAAVIIGVLLALTPTDAQGNAVAGPAYTAISVIGVLTILATVALGCVQQAPLRREIYSGAAPRQVPDAADP